MSLLYDCPITRALEVVCFCGFWGLEGPRHLCRFSSLPDSVLSGIARATLKLQVFTAWNLADTALQPLLGEPVTKHLQRDATCSRGRAQPILGHPPQTRGCEAVSSLLPPTWSLSPQFSISPSWLLASPPPGRSQGLPLHQKTAVLPKLAGLNSDYRHSWTTAPRRTRN